MPSSHGLETSPFIAGLGIFVYEFHTIRKTILQNAYVFTGDCVRVFDESESLTPERVVQSQRLAALG